MTDQATLLRRYHAALGEARTPVGLSSADLRFWPDGAPDRTRGLFEAHLARVRGEGSPADCDAALNQALREIGS